MTPGDTARSVSPRILRHARGRLRVHLDDWSADSRATIEAHFRKLPGVEAVVANPTTGNVLIRYDPEVTDREALLDAVPLPEPRSPRRRGSTRPPVAEPEAAAPRGRRVAPPALTEGESRRRRARLAVRGLDRNAALAARVVRVLGRRTGVTLTRASALTGRVLVEYDEHQVTLEDLLAEVTRLELPDLPGEDRPAHPLDPAPLIQSGARLAGATLGLGTLAVRRILRPSGEAPVAGLPATVAGVIGIVEGIPPLRHGLRSVLGRDRAELVSGAVSVVSLTFAGSPLGLALTGAGALRVFTEVRARRAAWREYEQRLDNAADAEPGALARLEAGDRAPLDGRVVEGHGTMIGSDGLPRTIGPGDAVTAGARLAGGPLVIAFDDMGSFVPEERPVPPGPTPTETYTRLLSPVALGYALLTAVVSRSPARTFSALLLVNGRPAMIGAEAASTSASARVLRAGATVVGSRPERMVRRPDVLLLDEPRLLSDRLEISMARALDPELDDHRVRSLAAAVAAAAGSPWGPTEASGLAAEAGRFDAGQASAVVEDVGYRLAVAPEADCVPARPGEYVLALYRERGAEPVGLVSLRPVLAPDVNALRDVCRDRGIELIVTTAADSPEDRALTERAGVRLAVGDRLALVRGHQQNADVVAMVSDSASAAEAFAACDLAIGYTSGRSGRFAARADLLAPDLRVVTEIMEAGARRDLAARDSAALSVVANVYGAVSGLRTPAAIGRASRATYVAALAAIGVGWIRLHGGARETATTAHLVDPRAERWGRQSPREVLMALGSSERGLTSARAARRVVPREERAARSALWAAVLDQLKSPLTAVLGVGAGVSLLVGEVADVGLIGAVIAVNTLVGVWQERQAEQAALALDRLGAASATALRDSEAKSVPADEIVVGDVLVLASGDRIAADARLLSAEGLELDEAPLTGESLPVLKSPDAASERGRVVLEGSDVTVGTGTAVVVAVGRDTRMGAMSAALDLELDGHTPLGRRLNTIMRQGLPIVIGGGALVVLAGLLWRRPLLPQLALGASVATAAVPEGLPLIAGVAEAAVARRLVRRGALVRRLAAVEALGRVDVACTDKTGTLTQGRLSVTLVDDLTHQADADGELSRAQREVLRAAALASPHPEASDAAAHPTDVAVVEAAVEHGLNDEVHRPRDDELPFDPARGFHASVSGGRLIVKGSADVLAPRCTAMVKGDSTVSDGEEHGAELLERARALAARGLRVLMVADGPAESELDDPRGLRAIGLIGISDPLRATVPAAVRRCQEAGVRLIMLTGDHPATARAIADKAGLPNHPGSVLTGAEMAELEDHELDRRLELAAVIARITPLDKVRIVEHLRANGHTVAMTGDGVNDAPALRLADAGIAMGRHGTEVARQAADVVLTGDDFSIIAEALVEGRGFWVNIRRSLGLLLGGNLGEIGLVVGASLLGLAGPLTTRQILAVNLVTDVLPALAVAVQEPEHRDLSALRREGAQDMDRALRRDMLRRGLATGAPSLVAYVIASRTGSLPQARSVAFAGVVANQLTQTVGVGRAEGTLTRPVMGAVALTGGAVVAALAVPALAGFFGLAIPSPLGLALIVGSSVAASMISGGRAPWLPRPSLTGAGVPVGLPGAAAA